MCAEGRFLAGGQTCVCLQHVQVSLEQDCKETLCEEGDGFATWEYFIWVLPMGMKCFRILFLKWHFSYLRRYNGFSVLLLKFKSTLKSWNQSLLFWLGQNISAAFVSRTVMMVVAFHCNKILKEVMTLVWDETCVLGKRPHLNHCQWVSISFAPWVVNTWRGLRTCSFWAESFCIHRESFLACLLLSLE